MTDNPETDVTAPACISGNLTADPELRFTGTGRAVCNLRVACSDRVRDEETGEWRDTPVEFVTVVTWGTLAENCAESLRRGDRVVAEGTWQDRQWTDRDGEVHDVTDLQARDAGPSLKWQAAQVRRAERSAADGRDRPAGQKAFRAGPARRARQASPA